MIKSFIKKIVNWSIKEEYNIGFVCNSYKDIINGNPIKIKWMKHKFRDSWFADPFILDVTETHILLLVEDFYYPIGRGRISLLKVNKETYICEERKPILTLDTHLSFPIIFRVGSDVFVYPESGASGKLKIYKYENESLKEFSTIADGSFCDAVITDFWGSKYCFTTRPSSADKETRLQYIYGVDNENHILDLVQSFCFDEKIARNAGNFFMLENKIYRPVQDCTVNYGGGIIIQEVKKNADDQFSFRNICRFDAKYKNLTLGAHTLNSYKGTIVIDAHGYCNPTLAKIAHFIDTKI